jgi:hypothetical protein
MSKVNKNNLVVLKSKTTTLISEGTQTKFEPNKHYRCIELSEGDYSEFLVYGVVFSKEAFENLFVYLHDVIIDQWSKNGLFPNNKQLSKKAFSEVLDIHTYGRGKGKLFIGFVGNKMDGLFAFQPLFKGDTKAKFLAYAYEMYKDTLNGDMTHVDDEMLQRGNSGIPLSFGDIYFKKEWNPNNEKREIYC